MIAPHEHPRFPRGHAVAVALVSTGLLLAGGGNADAQERYSYIVSLSPSLGGSVDGDPDGGLDNSGFQGSFSWRTEPRTVVGVRFGNFDLSGRLGALTDPTFRYATISGEYRFQELYFQSGVFFGLGLYQLSGAGDLSEEGAGLTVGVTGDFPINERFSVQVELAGHYADLDSASTFGGVQVGVAWQF